MWKDENRTRESLPEQWIRLHPDLIALLTVVTGLVVRLKAASGTFFNYDEALHFFVANQPSWQLTYQPSPLVSHPPLLTFLLHAWRAFGTSELMLRLPSALLGSAFCWVSFRWMRIVLGSTSALIGLMFLTFSPSLVSLSAEVRQYALLLFFASCALYWLERALHQGKEDSGSMVLSLLCLYLAILSHYSGVLFAAALGVYAVLRMSTGKPSRRIVCLWLVGQAVALAICAFLYFCYVAPLGPAALHGWMGDTYLHNSYFDPQHSHVFSFIAGRTVSVFQYIVLQSVVGAAAFVVFMVGIVLLAKQKSHPGTTGVRPYQLVTLLVLPFVIDCIAALAGKYPYGGTRHCAFLAIFAVAGIGFGLARLVGQRPALGMAVALVAIVACWLFPSRRLPYIARADQDRGHMQAFLAFVRQNVRPSDLIFSDNQTGMLLAHYLCQQQSVAVDESVPGYGSFRCGGYHVVRTDMDAFSFNPKNFLAQWGALPTKYGLKEGETVWVVQAGWLWEESLAQQLQHGFHGFRDLRPQSFGRNITIFELNVGGSSEPFP
jgi:hypothetical protein